MIFFHTRITQFKILELEKYNDFIQGIIRNQLATYLHILVGIEKVYISKIIEG